MTFFKRTGLATKIVGTSALVTVLVSAVISILASERLKRSLLDQFTTRGEAIALSLAAAAEQSVGGNSSALQSSIDSNKVIAGVRYIYILDADGSLLGHTFSPSFPEGLAKQNPLALGELTGHARVKVRPDVQFPLGDETLEAIDVAAPISGGALGVVHVGLNRRDVMAEVAALRRSMLLWGALVAILGIALSWAVAGAVVLRPVRRLTHVTRQIVGQGDLTLRAVVDSEDELGELARSFDEMVGKLREALTSLKESGGGLTQSMAELSLSTQEQTLTVTRQATALQETQVTAQEIKQTSAMASQKADAILAQSEQAEAVTQHGEIAIQSSLAGMADIRGFVGQIGERVQELSERTAQIGGITQTVKDLADQSNMLALNAAIEAVRSGEHGKGFAVVAREIRALADQSIAATRRVREVLEGTSSAILAVAKIAESGTQRIEAGLEQIRSSGESLQNLSGMVRGNLASVRQIAVAVSQQNAGIEQIFAAVNDLSAMMDETVRRLNATNSATVRLEAISGKSARIVAAYRV